MYSMILVCFKHMILIGNFCFTSLVIAKLDVLDTFEEVKIGISYKHKGNVLESFPGNVVNLCMSLVYLKIIDSICA